MAQLITFVVPVDKTDPSFVFSPPEGFRWKVVQALIVLKTGAAAGTRQLLLNYSIALEKRLYGAPVWLNTGAVTGTNVVYPVIQVPQGGIAGDGQALVQVNPYLEFGHLDNLVVTATLVAGDMWGLFLEALQEEDGD